MIHYLSDNDIESLSNMNAAFISGKNVNGLIKIFHRKVLEVTEENGVVIAMDFRIDDINGVRMRVQDAQDKELLDRLRVAVTECPFFSSDPKTGTCVIVNNKKVLHSREKITLTGDQLRDVLSGNLDNAPRLLYRSKGPMREPTR